MEIYECLYHCKEFFWCSSNNYTLNTEIGSFFCSLLIFLPYKRYFAFKVLSLSKIVKPYRFCAHLPFLLNFLLFYFQFPQTRLSHDNSFVMSSTYSRFSTKFPCLFFTKVSLRWRKSCFSLFGFNLLLDFIEVSDFEA